MFINRKGIRGSGDMVVKDEDLRPGNHTWGI